MTGKLASKVAIITGGASGMGEMTTQLFCAEGASVVFSDIQEKEGRAIEEKIRNTGGKATFVRADLRAEADIQRMVQTAIDQYGRVDILFSNAGVKSPLCKTHEITEADWDWVMGVNLKATYFCIKHVVPHMIRQRSGNIICNGSIAGFFTLPNQSVYNASKAAEIQFAKSVAADYGEYGIRCNVVCPGTIGGAFAEKYIHKSKEEGEQRNRGVSRLVPLGRMGYASEVASVVLFLASDDSSYINGAAIPIDGGITIGEDLIGLGMTLGNMS